MRVAVSRSILGGAISGSGSVIVDEYLTGQFIMLNS
jgi:hypothetical protein